MIVEKRVIPIERIESYGKGYLEKEKTRKEKIEKYMRQSSEATNFKYWLASRINLTILYKDKETEIILREISKKYREFNGFERIHIEAWKGKSSLKLIEEPDKFICITFRKEEKDSEPKEIKKEIIKKEINDLLIVLGGFKEKEKIPTPKIAEKFYKMNWKEIFSDRIKHITLTYIFNILEQKGYIKYHRSGKVTILKNLENANWKI